MTGPGFVGLPNYRILHMLCRIDDALANIVGGVFGLNLRFRVLRGGVAAVVFYNGVGGILGVAPGFLHMAFYLIGCTFVGELIVAYSFA